MTGIETTVGTGLTHAEFRVCFLSHFTKCDFPRLKKNSTQVRFFPLRSAFDNRHHEASRKCASLEFTLVSVLTQDAQDSKQACVYIPGKP